MNAYKIMYSAKALKQYATLPIYIRHQVDEKMSLVAENPYARNNNIRAILGRERCYRLRIGDWRVVYEIVKQELIIYVIKIAHRKEVYRI